MVKGIIYIAASLDGFVARENGDLDWLMKQDTAGEDFGYDALMASVDGLVMGRGSYKTVAGFDEWPYQKPVIVLSKSLTQHDIPARLRDKVMLSRETPSDLMQRLDTEGWKAAYIDGGLVVQSFLRDGLIDEITLTHIPILLGSGKPLFGPLNAEIDLVHVSTTSYKSGLVHSHYRLI
ncbi:MAG: dihydrofolate reductase [Rhodobacteraceae bacterium]|nr:dihydrofolate reductase [Paracoccaceae bacterium]